MDFYEEKTKQLVSYFLGNMNKKYKKRTRKKMANDREASELKTS